MLDNSNISVQCKNNNLIIEINFCPEVLDFLLFDWSNYSHLPA